MRNRTHRLLDGNTVAVKFTVSRTTRVTETTVGVFIPVLRSGEVGLRSVGPEDWSDRFSPTLWRKRLESGRKFSASEYNAKNMSTYLTPRERLDCFHSCYQTQLFQYHLGALLEVHGIEVQSTNA